MNIRFCKTFFALLLGFGLQCGSPLFAQNTNSAPVYLGAYVNIPRLFDPKDDIAGREKAIKQQLDLFKQSGLRVVLPYVNTTSGLAYYPSQLIPQRAYEDWDPLAFFIAEARKRGLETCPVIVALVCGHNNPKGALLRNPGWALRDTDGKSIGHISPAHPDARAFVTGVAEEIVTKYQTDGVLLDYLRYPNQTIRLDPEGERTFEAALKSEPNLTLQMFKERSLTDLAGQISSAVRTARPGAKVAIYSWGPHVTQNHRVAQDWKTWARRGYIDRVDVSGYCYRDNYGERFMEVFEKRLRDALDVAGDSGVTVALTLGIRTSHGDIQSSQEIDDYLQVAARVGIQGVGVFTWDYLQPHLQESIKGQYLTRFENALNAGK